MRIVFVLLFTLNGLVFGKEWTANNMPDPRDKSGYMKCNMKSLSRVCDPDEVLPSTDRYRINHELNQLAQRTTHSGGNFCQTKGIESILVAVQSGSQKLANNLAKQWNLDQQCKKSVIFVLSTQDHKFYYSGEDNTGLTSADFEAIVSGQRQLLDEGHFTKAIVNILKQIGGEKNQQAGTRNDLGGTTRGGSRGSQDNGNGASLVNVSILLAFLAVILRFL